MIAFKRSVPSIVHLLLTFYAVTSLFSAVDLRAQGFERFRKQIALVSEMERQAVADSFISALRAFPLVELDSVCTFLWSGVANQVAIAGDQNGWNPARGAMARHASTNVWFRTDTFPSDARLDYKIVKDGATWLLDARNPQTMTSGFGPNSELRMPAWVAPRETRYNPKIPHGKLVDTSLSSAVFGTERKFRVYIPAVNMRRSGPPGVIVVHDGFEYVDIAKIQVVLDNLIAAKQIRPVLAVFVPPVERSAEYGGEAINKYTSFIVAELLPIVARRYGARIDSTTCATMGASAGGNVSLWLAAVHPEVFGGVAAQSTSVSEDVAHLFLDGPKRNLRIYLDMGMYDIPVLLPMVQRLREILDSRGYAYVYRELHEGHSWGSWRARLGDILRYLYPVSRKR